MKQNILYKATALIGAMAIVTSCNDNDFIASGPSASQKISLEGEISQVYQTRVSDTGFCDGDAIGVYIVD